MFPSLKNVKKRHSHVVVMQRQLTNVQKSIMHVQSCCFANLNPLLSCRTLCRRRHHCLSTLLAPISKARDCRYNKTPFNTDTEGGTESVLLNGVSVKWGLTPGVGGGGGTWVNVCWVYATGLSKPQPHHSLFFGQL